MKALFFIMIWLLAVTSCTSFQTLDCNTISSKLIAKTLKHIDYSNEHISLYLFLADQDSTFVQFAKKSDGFVVPPRLPDYPPISNLKLDKNCFNSLIDVCNVDLIIDFSKRKDDNKWGSFCNGILVLSNPFFDIKKGLVSITEWKIFPIGFERYEVGHHVFIKRGDDWKYGGYNVLFLDQQSIEDHLLN